jgi:hypothetical protein
VSRAISIRQPWAWAIVHAGKDVENRSLNAARAYLPAIGQRIFIHASARRPTKDDIEWLAGYFHERDLALPPMSALPFGGIVGSAVVTDIVASHRSRWFDGQMALVLADAREEPYRPLKGALGLWKVR